MNEIDVYEVKVAGIDNGSNGGINSSVVANVVASVVASLVNGGNTVNGGKVMCSGTANAGNYVDGLRCSSDSYCSMTGHGRCINGYCSDRIF